MKPMPRRALPLGPPCFPEHTGDPGGRRVIGIIELPTPIDFDRMPHAGTTCSQTVARR